MFRHSCGYKLANDGQDIRAIQHYLGHRRPFGGASVLYLPSYSPDLNPIELFFSSCGASGVGRRNRGRLGGIGRRALQHDDLGSYLDPAIEIRDVFVGEPASAGGVCDASMLVEASPISGMSSTSDYHPAKLEKHHDHLYHPAGRYHARGRVT